MTWRPHLIYCIIIALLLFYVGCFDRHPCPKQQQIAPVVQKAPKVIGEGVIVPKKIIKPKSIAAHRPKPVTTAIPEDITFSLPDNETACDEIIKTLYTTRFYSETYKDSAMSITVQDSVSGNEITWQKASYIRLLPDYIVSNPIRNKIFIGGGFGAGLPGITDIGVTVMGQNKRDQVGYIHANFWDRSVQMGVMWKIILKKR